MNEIACPVPLYHGTSTLFLRGIIDAGLGAHNPLDEWRVLEFAREILPLVEQHLIADEYYEQKVPSYRLMVQQFSGDHTQSNFQHGQTYLTPVVNTAVRYAANTRYGSELLSYTLDMLDGLLRRGVRGVRDQLYQRYRALYQQQDVSVAPVLVRVSGLTAEELRTELGGDVRPSFVEMRKYLTDGKKFDVMVQQTNFRLSRPVPKERLALFLVCVSRYDPFSPEYNLHPISTRYLNSPKHSLVLSCDVSGV